MCFFFASRVLGRSFSEYGVAFPRHVASNFVCWLSWNSSSQIFPAALSTNAIICASIGRLRSENRFWPMLFRPVEAPSYFRLERAFVFAWIFVATQGARFTHLHSIERKYYFGKKCDKGLNKINIIILNFYLYFDYRLWGGKMRTIQKKLTHIKRHKFPETLNLADWQNQYVILQKTCSVKRSRILVDSKPLQ